MIAHRNGMLHVGGISAADLVEQFGEPLYIFDGETIAHQVARLRHVLAADIRLLYSMKANPNVSIVGLLTQLLDGLEVSSLGELHVARRAGMPPERITFVGPAKSDRELGEALVAGVGAVVVESEHELLRLEAIARAERRPAHVAFRINPDGESVGQKLRMGGAARQFGIDEHQIEDVVLRARDRREATIRGLHAYVGTRILDAQAIAKNTRSILEIACRLCDRTGVTFEFVDVGGGFGVPYYHGETALDLDALGTELTHIHQWFRAEMPETRVVIELGRFLVAESGLYVARVRDIKSSKGRTFVLVGGGFNHMMAATGAGSLVKQHFPIEVVDGGGDAGEEEVDICGALCTPADVLAKGARLAVGIGDLVAVRNAGAYGLTASPVDFLSHLPPPEVIVWQGAAHLIRRRPDVSDITRNHVFVPLASPAATALAAASAAR
jgi:diaminopimelate decarboxylase